LAASRPRLYCPAPLASGRDLLLPPGAARHVQVLRMQPGGLVTLFNGEGGEFEAQIERMGRSDVAVRVGAHDPVEREAACEVHLAVGMPANDRMDWLVEKATELGAASLQPLAVERSVLKLSGERADKKQQHWQGIAVAACEQCGRNRVPQIRPVLPLAQWLQAAQARRGAKLLLAPSLEAQPIAGSASEESFTVLSGPEGGLSPAEQQEVLAAGFAAVHLGPRVLRAETAPLAALAVLTLRP
jgi:16S rRNA (uracil1498-N3)-methyltransferase